MVDLMGALVSFLQADATLAALVGTRVYAQSLPKADAASMPRDCVVIRSAGGPGSRDYVKLTEVRIDVMNYGATERKAHTVHRATHDALKYMEREVQGDVLLHRANDSGGPVWLRDPDGDWPLCVETWLVLAAETTAA